MKKPLIVGLLACALLSCENGKNNTSNAPKEIAKDSIQAFIKRTMDDPKTYEPISFSELEPYTERDSLVELRGILMDKAGNYTGINSDSANGIIGRAEKIKEMIDRLEGKEKLIGFRVVHKFRGSNKFGAVVLNELEFQMGQDYKVNRVIK